MAAASHHRPSRPIHVTFDCPGASPVLFPATPGGIGGAEVRAVKFAQAVAAHADMDVRFVVSSDQPRAAKPVDAVTVHFENVQHKSAWSTVAKWWASAEKRLWQIPGRRAFFEQWSTDVICCFGVTNRTASVIRTARGRRWQSIVFLTSDRTLDDLQRHGRRDVGAYGEQGSLCRYALSQASAVVAQKESQQASLRQRLGIQSHLIRNPMEIDTRPETPPPGHLTNGPGYILWVGRADTFSKRADLAIEIARRLPRRRFVFVMNRHDPSVYEQLMQAMPANVHCVEHVPLKDIENYFQHADLLLNTSDAEGFPNSFLQAGKYGVPIVSLQVDPDGILARHQLGVFANGALDHAVREIQRIGTDATLREAMSRRAHHYVSTHHEITTCARQLAALIRSIARSSKAA